MQRQIVMFAGVDTSEGFGLWETNGTATGTHELTGISGATGGLDHGLDPSDFTVFNGEVLFGGQDTNGDFDLWVTDGSSDPDQGSHRPTNFGGHCGGHR